MRHLDLLDCMALNDESQRDCESRWPSNPNHDHTMAKAPVIIPPLSEKDKCRFYSKIKIVESGCHEWQNTTYPRGYGRFKMSGYMHRTHRIAFFLSTGGQPWDFLVCHKCDNPRCVNPDHLFLGTARDNAQDMLSKGRGNKAKGERHGRAVLTGEIVMQIREIYSRGKPNQTEVAKKFGVTRATVSKVVTQRTWRDTTP